MEQELNIYGDVSGGWIFDQMDRYAHERAVEYIGDCVTASANIHYFTPISEDIVEHLIITSEGEELGTKCYITANMHIDDKIYATASFLFIKRK